MPDDLFAVGERPSRPPAILRNTPTLDIAGMSAALVAANEPADVRAIEQQLDLIEQHMRDSGLYTPEQIRQINELRMRARWKLGRLLAAIDRAAGPGRGRKIQQGVDSFLALLGRLKLDHQTATRAQRIGTLPEDELEKALAAAHKGDDGKPDGFFATFAYLLDRARPYWYATSRKQRHQTIEANALAAADDSSIGPFPLIYADPPWKFEIYSEKGLERTPDQHYPTLTDDQIADFRVGDRTIPELAHRDAALLLWCTSSNLERALAIMARWGFTFKTSAVWVKDKGGLGLVFRVKHELLLYGIRGKMPGPQYQPSSVFEYPRGEHSAKPPEIRAEIERMYPDFGDRTRLELFARTTSPGWTCRGFEAAT